MKSLNLKFFFKLLLALLLAFLVSQILVTKVTYKEIPVFRPSFQQIVHNLPTKIAFQTKRIASYLNPLNLLTSHLPPPWIAQPVKPTIVAYKPPVYIPPTLPADRQASTPPPTPTSTPFIPPPTATAGPSPTPGLYPTATPTSIPQLSSTPIPTSPPTEAKAELLRLINQERQKNDTASLAYHTSLDQAAQAHAQDMLANNYFSHTGADGSSPSDRAQRSGYSSPLVGENIYKSSADPNRAFSAWMSSDGHRQNMLNPFWEDAGVGLAGTIWVLLLGTE